MRPDLSNDAPRGASGGGPPGRLRALVRAELWRHRRALAAASGCTLAMAATDLLRPWPVKLVVDHVLLGRPVPSSAAPLGMLLEWGQWPALVACTAGIVVIAAVTAFFAYYQVHFATMVGNHLVHTLRRETFAHVQRLSLTFHAKVRPGELLTTVSQDTGALKEAFTESLLTLALHSLTVVGAFVVMFVLNWRLALVVLATMPILCWNLLKLFARTREATRAKRAKDSKLSSYLHEVFSSAPVVQAFGREGHEQRRFTESLEHHLHDAIRLTRLDALSARAVELTGALATAIVVTLGAAEVMAGRLSVGAVLVFTSYLHGLYRPMRNLAKLSSRMARAQVAAERLSRVLDTAPEAGDAPDAREAVGLRGEIVFDRVSFVYDGGGGVRDVSLRIGPGQRVAVVGHSGAGKSTLMNLLLRLYEPSSGRISIDGRDIREYRRASLRGAMAVVLQQGLLFGASVRENIAYGKPDATDEDVRTAARGANAHDFIEALPQGYDTVLGERGATLSGGERQRLAIARAMIRPASILLLDEPMTGLDGRTEALVHDALQRLTVGKTCVLITHDIGAVRRSDLVVVMDGGCVVDQGTHDELLARSRYYRELAVSDTPSLGARVETAGAAALV